MHERQPRTHEYGSSCRDVNTDELAPFVNTALPMRKFRWQIDLDSRHTFLYFSQ